MLQVLLEEIYDKAFQSMIRLALDLAKRTGYAIRFEDGSVKVGEWHLGRGSVGGNRSPLKMVRLWRRLYSLHKYYGIELVIYEETFAPGFSKFDLDSLQYTTLLFCGLIECSWVRVNPPQWKKAVVGNGKAKRDEYFAFAERNWPMIPIWTDNQAAALCLLEYYERQRAL